MKETGILNRDLAALLSEQGHMDTMIVCDAGFPIPEGIPVVDLSLKNNVPKVIDVLEELKNHYSVEEITMAKETEVNSPSHFNAVKNLWEGIPVKTVFHIDLKKMSHDVKFVVRTGDFTAYGNVYLTSGSGSRWFVEKK